MQKIVRICCIFGAIFLSACSFLSEKNPWPDKVDKNKSVVILPIDATYQYVDTSGTNSDKTKSLALEKIALTAVQNTFAHKGYKLKELQLTTEQKNKIEEQRKFLLTNLVAKGDLERFWYNRYRDSYFLHFFKHYPVHRYTIGSTLANSSGVNNAYAVFVELQNVDYSAGAIASGSLRALTSILTLGTSEILNRTVSDGDTRKREFLSISVVDLQSGNIVYDAISFSTFDHQDPADVEKAIRNAMRKSSF